jgi:two-component system NtrC family sensor kinase
MTPKVKFPIRAKLLLLMSSVILAAVAAYLALAVQIFKEDKTSLIYELNASTVRTLAAELESSLAKSSDKVRLLTQGHRDAEWTRTVLESESDLVSYELYRATQDASRWDLVSSLRNRDYLKLYGLEPAEIDRMRTESPLPFAAILAQGSWATNSTLPEGAPILTLAQVVRIEGVGDHVAVIDLRLDRVLKLVSEHEIATVYIIDREGRIVAHPDAQLVSTRTSFAEVPIVKKALSSTVALKMEPFDWKGARWLGAYASVGIGGLTVVSQIEEQQAFRASRTLIEKSALFGLLIVTAGLLISGWVASGLTGPIRRLLEATDKLSRWEFGESVYVKSNDELAHLARAFNAMATDLQTQRTQLEANQAELELKVKERTAALEAQRTLVSEAQEALLRTTRLASLGELAGAAAHEVLNPVNNINIRVERISTSIRELDSKDAQLLEEIVLGWKKAYDEKGWAGLEGELKKPAGDRTLLEEDLENLSALSRDARARAGEREKDMGFLMAEVARVTKIINNMRSLSRVGGERRPLDVHLPIDHTAATLADFLSKRGVTLTKHFSESPRSDFTVVGDRDELVQVFTNLIRNSTQAIHEADRREGEIRISTRRNGDRIEIRISDNGTGIKAEHLGKIFEPSFTTKSLAEGTGLGLSISRRLVRAFNGDIEVEETVEGKGTTFLIWFPVAS